MLTSVQFREEDNTSLLSLPIGVPSPSNPFFVREVEGLDPVRASVTTTSYSIMDGAKFQHAGVDIRNIVMTIAIKPSTESGSDPSSHRDAIYRDLPPKSAVILVFTNTDYNTGGSSTVRIKGYIESVESPIFSSETEIQVSIICPDPYFSNNAPIKIPGTTGVPLDLSPLGSAPVGFLMDITVAKAMSKLTLDATGFRQIVFGAALGVDDRLRISTIPGDKYVKLTKATGVTTNRLTDISSGSLAMALDSRTRAFYVNKGATGTDQKPYTIQITPKHVGL